MKFLILTKTEFEAAEKEACKRFGYPKGKTERYADLKACEIKVNGQIRYKFPYHDWLKGEPVEYDPKWESHKRKE